jgi:ribosomal protein S18 acetylase RimI-like enzyme
VISYRVATSEDAGALATLARETWVHTFGTLYPPEDLNAYLTAKYGEAIQRAEIADQGTLYFLAERDGALVGYCMVGALEMPVDDSNAVELHRLYVSEDVKGAGVAQALMQMALDWARSKDADAIYLSVWENNHRAQRFYRRYGFVDHGEWDFMVGRVADRDFIWKLDLR